MPKSNLVQFPPMGHQSIVGSGGSQSPAERRRERDRIAVLELRRYRRERSLTCEQLAAEFGVSVDSIERYLCGRRAVPGHIVIALVGQLRRAA